MLDHAEDDRADKGEREIRGDNAQSAHEGIHEGHSEISRVRVAARVTLKIAKRSRRISQRCCHLRRRHGAQRG